MTTPLLSSTTIPKDEDQTGVESFDKPIVRNGRFANPWATWKGKINSWTALFRFLFLERDLSNIPKQEQLDKTLPIRKPNFAKDTEANNDQARITWIGHATVLMELDGVKILTDPIFSLRCSPVQWLGVKRYRLAACTIDELPPIDIVLISHNHYDHLDLNSVRHLHRRFGANIHWFVPLGLKNWFRETGIKNVTECNWWDEVNVPELKAAVVCTPNQHWSTRILFDRCKTLWSSWIVIGQSGRKFYFAGDTGYSPAFKSIGTKYGPIDCAAIPIGCYEPRSFLRDQHCNPEEAVQIHQDIKSKFSLGIHWGTFHMGSTEFYLEPKTRLKDALRANNLSDSEFITLEHGETFSIS